MATDVWRFRALSEDSVPPVRDIIDGKVSLFSGHSGVGKVYAAQPHCSRYWRSSAPAEVSSFANKGVHTNHHLRRDVSGESRYLCD